MCPIGLGVAGAPFRLTLLATLSWVTAFNSSEAAEPPFPESEAAKNPVLQIDRVSKQATWWQNHREAILGHTCTRYVKGIEHLISLANLTRLVLCIANLGHMKSQLKSQCFGSLNLKRQTRLQSHSWPCFAASRYLNSIKFSVHVGSNKYSGTRCVSPKIRQICHLRQAQNSPKFAKMIQGQATLSRANCAVFESSLNSFWCLMSVSAKVLTKQLGEESTNVGVTSAELVHSNSVSWCILRVRSKGLSIREPPTSAYLAVALRCNYLSPFHVKFQCKKAGKLLFGQQKVVLLVKLSTTLTCTVLLICLSDTA